MYQVAEAVVLQAKLIQAENRVAELEGRPVRPHPTEGVTDTAIVDEMIGSQSIHAKVLPLPVGSSEQISEGTAAVIVWEKFKIHKNDKSNSQRFGIN